MGMKFVLLVLKLCIPVVSSVVNGSGGYNKSPSPAIFSILPPVEYLGYHEKSLRTFTPSAGSVLLSPLVLPLHKPDPVPQTIQGSAPSMPLSPPIVEPSHKPAPVPQTIQGLVPSVQPSSPIVEPSPKSAPLTQTMPGIVPSMFPSPPIVVPSHKPAPVPQTFQGLVPSLPPRPPTVEPSHMSAPQPQTMPGLVPSMPPSLPIVVSSHKPAPVPQTIQGLVPPIPSSLPTIKSAPLPQTILGFVPSMPPSPPIESSRHKPAPMPQIIHGLVPSMPPNPLIAEPSHKSAPPPQTMLGLVPSTLPSSPIVSPPHKLASTHETIQGLVPSMPPRPSIEHLHKSTPLPQTMPRPLPSMPPSAPIVVPSHKLSPVPSIPIKSAPMPQTILGLIPSMPPNPPIVSPPHKLAPVHQTIQGLVPSMPPRPPIEPSHKTTPMPQTMPGLIPSMPPNPPIVSPPHKPTPAHKTVKGLVPSMPSSPPIVSPPHKPASAHKTVRGLVPSIPPSPRIVEPSHKSAPLTQTMPRLVPSIPPNPPIVVPSHKLAPQPQTMPGLVPSMPPSPPIGVPLHKLAPLPQTMPPSSPIVVPFHKMAPLPQTMPGHVPSMPPSPPIAVPSHKSPSLPQPLPGLVPSMPPITSTHRRAPDVKLPITVPRAPVPVPEAPKKSPRNPSSMPSTMPGVAPSLFSDPAISPMTSPLRSISRKRYGMPVAAPPKEMFSHLSPMNHSPTKAPAPDEAARHFNHVSAPSSSSPKPSERKWIDSPASSPLEPSYKIHHERKGASSPAPAPSYLFPPPSSYHQGSIILPAPSHPPTAPPKKSNQRHYHPPPMNYGPSVSPVQPPYSSAVSQGSLPPLPSSTVPTVETKRPVLPPTISPLRSPPRKPKMLLPSPIQSLPPPPPNQNCISQTCTEPFTNSPPGSPCVCVLPMKVGLSLSVALYNFFPLVSELAEEIAAGVFMKQSQVRIMGANAASQQLDKTIVLIDLVPLGDRFDYTTAFLTYEKFWQKQVAIKTSFFGDYEVLYVHYPGLPPSPPLPPSTTIINEIPYTSNGNNARTIHPLGVDVRKQKGGFGGSTIAIIVLSSFVAMVLCIGAAWFFVLKCGRCTFLAAPTSHTLGPSLAKQAGAARSLVLGSGLSSASLSFGSSITTYAGSARTFSADEIERATDSFDDSRILGEGGFGRVYKGILDNGTEVAVKVLKRDDQQGGREFFAEVEMLSRLHHRNLVKLIGICIENHVRCLIYELIPNGSVESHLHGVDKETAPLDWASRVKIALGSARGLAYLHEDSSPHVIHRDFKSSNILLEHNFTPKVSDFGLARTALDEENKHILTRVMGTFGYVAPEYAMTGHLLVKSDVYSYGVVLLELLTGRKPVDMSQPPGQENLVTWARPLLTSKEGLEMMIDPALGTNFPFDGVAKVAAIASMCVQPEVSHRPFMGEVVQALKLVCNEYDDTKVGSESCGREDSSIADIDVRPSTCSGQFEEPPHAHYPDYDSSSLETGRALSVLDMYSSSAKFERQTSGSFNRNFISEPLRTERNKQFWQRVTSLSRGSVS